MRAWLLDGSDSTAVRSATAALLKWPSLNSAKPRLSSTPGRLGLSARALSVGGGRFLVLLLLWRALLPGWRRLQHHADCVRSLSARPEQLRTICLVARARWRPLGSVTGRPSGSKAGPARAERQERVRTSTSSCLGLRDLNRIQLASPPNTPVHSRQSTALRCQRGTWN